MSIDATTPTTLAAEAEWLETAHANAVALGRFSPQYLAGFKAAAGWVRIHAEEARSQSEERDVAYWINAAREINTFTPAEAYSLMVLFAVAGLSVLVACALMLVHHG